MANEQFKLEGAKEVMDAMKALPVELQQKVLKSFIRKAGKKFIVDELKTVLSYSPKTEESIQVVTANDDKLAVQAGVTGKGYKLRWTDLGTKQRKTRKGWNRGSVAGRHQIQPLIESQVEDIVDYTEKELGNEVNKILERKLRKLKKSL